MSRKLTRHLEDIERTERKMAELQAHLEAVRQSQKADEDAEIVRSIRAMNVKGWELVNLLEGLQNGTVKLQPAGDGNTEEDADASPKDTEDFNPDENTQAQDAPESEDNDHEED